VHYIRTGILPAAGTVCKPIVRPFGLPVEGDTVYTVEDLTVGTMTDGGKLRVKEAAESLTKLGFGLGIGW